jgi:hypothetical protein
MRLAEIQETAAPQGLGTYRALPNDLLNKPVVRNGIQEVDGSIPFSSTNKIKPVDC